MNATREHLGLTPLDPALIYSYVGNGAPVLVKKAIGEDTPHPVLEDALAFFLRYYRAHALEHTRFYPGVRESLERLSREGHTLSVLTNKPVRISRDIISALNVSSLFHQIYGGDSFAAKKPDAIGVTTLLSETHTPAGDALLVGDSGVDVQTARNAGVRCCGVSWGFQPEAFRQWPPDTIIHRPEELVAMIATYRFHSDG